MAGLDWITSKTTNSPLPTVWGSLISVQGRGADSIQGWKLLGSLVPAAHLSNSVMPPPHPHTPATPNVGSFLVAMFSLTPCLYPYRFLCLYAFLL